MEQEAKLGDQYLGAKIGSRRRTHSATDDYSVQKTNDDATECKFTAVKLDYYKDPFIQQFVGVNEVAPRRDPEISRGYWARVSAIKVVVNAFLKKFGANAQIINLGAGYDTLYWRLKRAHKQFSKFVEIDFSSVTAKKIRKIGGSNISTMFTESPRVIEHTDMHAGDYHLIGADLRQCNELRDKIESCKLSSNAPTLFLCECVLVYMGMLESQMLLTELADWFPNSFLVNYEQVNISDTFGKVMINNLQQRGILLPGLDACDTLDTQKKRFLSNKWKHVEIKTMKEIFDNHLPRAEIERIENIELLDEKILLSQLLEHYCFLVASRSGDALELDWNEFI